MSVSMTKDEIFGRVRETLAGHFELDPAAITLASTLFEELDLDSIDAVDLALSLQEMTGRRVQPETFTNVRTVGDVVDVVHRMLQG